MKQKNAAVVRHLLGGFSLILVTVGAVDSIRNLPTAALFGSSLVFFFIFGAILFLFPSALVAAELVSTWPECGGVYVWVREAFGKKTGFLAIWFQWVENVIWFPTVLSFIAGSIGYMIAPNLASNRFFLVSIIIASFWLVTIVNLRGVNSSVRLGNFCTIFGLLIPIALIIVLGIKWVLSGRVINIDLTDIRDLEINIRNPHIWIALTGIMLSFCGLEITTVHALDVHKPHKSYPKALLISALILLVTLILGALAIAVVIPGTQINLISGVMQTFDAFFSFYGMHWIMPLIAFSLVLGGIGGVSSWILAPTRGLLMAARDGHLPPHCCKENRHGAPSSILLYQAIIVTFVVMIFWLMPSVGGSYWFLTVLAAQLYMLMYIFMFVSAIYLRYKHPNLKRPFCIPGGKIGIWIVAGFGILAASLTFIIGFIPPHNINTGGVWRYEIMLISCLLLASLPPLLSRKALAKSLVEDKKFLKVKVRKRRKKL
ncbi:MAG: amino acid permease [Gammaproteobacteria bacterium]